MAAEGLAGTEGRRATWRWWAWCSAGAVASRLRFLSLVSAADEVTAAWLALLLLLAGTGDTSTRTTSIM